jgi:hypothetical protein
MDQQQLYLAVQPIAGMKAAVVISDVALSVMLLNRLTAAIKEVSGLSFPTLAPGIDAQFVRISVLPSDFKITTSTNGDFVTAAVSPAFTATLAIHPRGFPGEGFSEIEYSIQKLNFTIKAVAPHLLFSNPDFDVTGTIIELPTRTAGLVRIGLDEQRVIQVEGALAYLLASNLVSSFLGRASSVDLEQTLRAFSLKGEWKLIRFQDGLLILPNAGIDFTENQGCPSHDSAPDLSIIPGPPQDHGAGKVEWPIDHDPIPQPPYRKPTQVTGSLSVYLPRPILEKRFSGFKPSATLQLSDNGFIGYELTFTVVLDYMKLLIDVGRRGLVLDLEITATGTVFLTVDVPCAGRKDIGYARMNLETSKISIFLSFVSDGISKLALSSSIDGLAIGKVVANVSAFGRWLSFAGGKAAVIGYILDAIIEGELVKRLPDQIRDAIKDAVNHNNFPLIDATRIFRNAKLASFGGDRDGILVGLAIDPG